MDASASASDAPRHGNVRAEVGDALGGARVPRASRKGVGLHREPRLTPAAPHRAAQLDDARRRAQPPPPPPCSAKRSSAAAPRERGGASASFCAAAASAAPAARAACRLRRGARPRRHEGRGRRAVGCGKSPGGALACQLRGRRRADHRDARRLDALRRVGRAQVGGAVVARLPEARGLLVCDVWWSHRHSQASRASPRRTTDRISPCRRPAARSRRRARPARRPRSRPPKTSSRAASAAAVLRADRRDAAADDLPTARVPHLAGRQGAGLLERDGPRLGVLRAGRRRARRRR